MSAGNMASSETAIAAPITKKSKHDKKDRDGERKRKRDDAEGTARHKSKKIRADQQGAVTQEIQSQPAQAAPSLNAAAKVEQVVDSTSPFHLQTSTLYLPLSPVSQLHALEGICAEHLSPLILTYYPPFSGVILSYNNARLSHRPFEPSAPRPAAAAAEPTAALLQNIDEFAVSWAWVTADFLLFKPSRNAWLEGYVNLQNDGHLGLVCWNLFNASIERARLPASWRWVAMSDAAYGGAGDDDDVDYASEGIGHYVDGDGKKVDGTIRFRVKDIESSFDRERGFLSIEGTMLGDDEEATLLEGEKAKRRVGAVGRRGGAKALGATSLGQPVERDDSAGAQKRKRY